jgi:hypothetical protein
MLIRLISSPDVNCTQSYSLWPYTTEQFSSSLHENIPKEVMPHELLRRLRNGSQQWETETSVQEFTKLLILHESAAWTNLVLTL